MSLSLGGGLQTGGGGAAALAGQDVIARSFTATQAAGSNAFAAETGARWKIGGGTTDYFTSDGNLTITAAGSLSVGNALTIRNNTASVFVNVGVAGTQYFSVSTVSTAFSFVVFDMSLSGDIRPNQTTGSVGTRMGSSTTGTFSLAGVANANTTAVGNVGAGEDDLMTYSLPANSLLASHGMRVTAWGSAANNANAKVVKMYFGATAILTTSLTTSQDGTWRITANVVRTGAATQVASAQLLQGGATTLVDCENTAPAETLSGAVTIKCTGEAVDDNDIQQLGMIVEYL